MSLYSVSRKFAFRCSKHDATSPVPRGHQGRQPSYIRILNLEKILYKILTCHGGNLFEECPSIHEVHESWYHLPIIQSLFYTTFLNNLFTKTRAVFKICFDCFWILEPWLSFLVVWSAKSCSICEFDFLLHFAANRLHHRISQFQHISLRYLQFSCCLGLYFGTLTLFSLNL